MLTEDIVWVKLDKVVRGLSTTVKVRLSTGKEVALDRDKLKLFRRITGSRLYAELPRQFVEDSGFIPSGTAYDMYERVALPDVGEQPAKTADLRVFEGSAQEAFEGSEEAMKQIEEHAQFLQSLEEASKKLQEKLEELERSFGSTQASVDEAIARADSAYNQADNALLNTSDLKSRVDSLDYDVQDAGRRAVDATTTAAEAKKNASAAQTTVATLTHKQEKGIMSNIDIKGGSKQTAKTLTGKVIEGAKDSLVQQTGNALCEMIATQVEKRDVSGAAFLRTDFGKTLLLTFLAGSTHFGATSGLIPLKPGALMEFSERTIRNESKNAVDLFGGELRQIAMGAFMELGTFQEKLDQFDMSDMEEVAFEDEAFETLEVTESATVSSAKG